MVEERGYMGRYKRKPYKKQRMDFYHHKAIEDEIEDEVESFFNQDQEESILFLNEEPLFLDDEPEIVKQLRHEELNGKLPLWLADFNKENTDNSIPKKQDPSEKTSSIQSKTDTQISSMK